MHRSTSCASKLRTLLLVLFSFFGCAAPLLAQYWVEQSRNLMPGGVTDGFLAPNGDRYFAGRFEFGFTLGAFPLVSPADAGFGAGRADYLAKQGADGTWQWAYPLYGAYVNSIRATASGELVVNARVYGAVYSYRGTEMVSDTIETHLLRFAAADGALLGVLAEHPTVGFAEGLSGDWTMFRFHTALVLLDEAGLERLNEPAVTDSTAEVDFVGECANGDVIIKLRYERGPCTFLGATYGAAGVTAGDLVLLRVTRQGDVVWSVVGMGLGTRWCTAVKNLTGAVEVFFETAGAIQWAGVEVPAATSVRFRLSEDGAYMDHQILDMEKATVRQLIPLAGGAMLATGMAEMNTRLGTFQGTHMAPSGRPPFLAQLSAEGEWQQAHFFSMTPGTVAVFARTTVVGDLCLVPGSYLNNLAFGGVSFPPPTAPSPALMGFSVLFGRNCMATMIDTLVHASCAQSTGGAISLQVVGGTAPYTWTWADGATTPERTGLSAGMYPVEIHDAGGCSVSAGAYVQGPIEAPGHDVMADFFSYYSFRPGTQTVLRVRTLSQRCSPVDAHMQVVLDPRVTLVGGLADGDVVNGDTLFLAMGTTSALLRPIRWLQVETDTTLQVGDSLCFHVSVTPIVGDTDPSNNVLDLCFPVVNSYDPNDKTVIPAGTGPEGVIDTTVHTLTYLVRFQNTGNAPAFDVFIDDTLDTDLDLSRLELLETSHPMQLELRHDRVLRFRFDDINLPDSTHDEPNSHGHVLYRVPLRNGAGPGTVIRNTAHIFFDFNPAVVTNTTVNTIQLPVSVHERSAANALFSLAPNPVDHTLRIMAPDVVAGTMAHVRDMAGRVVLTVPVAGVNTLVDVAGLASGAYLVQLGAQALQFIKVQ